MYYQNIHGWMDFENLYAALVNQLPNNSTFVEVGCWLGKSICFFAEIARLQNKHINIFAVDTWEGSDEQEHRDHIKSMGGTDELYKSFLKNMTIAGVAHLIKPIRAASLKAAESFKDESISAVFIDASHFYEDVKADIGAWLPKIKKGGVIMGHDWPWPDVKKAVLEFWPESELEIVGSSWVKSIQ